MNMFKQLILLPLLLLQISYILANRYGAYCGSDSDCDQNQKCLSRVCRCNMNERRFWTGEICAVCVAGFLVTIDRCYQSINELKTWTEARTYCRARYADLFTWRNNNDEQFIRPVTQNWAASASIFITFLQLSKVEPAHPYVAWAGAVITSLNPHTTKWMDSDGIRLDVYSSEWCDPTRHAGYTLPREPTSESKRGPNGTEREECVTYNFGTSQTSLLCLADDYCSKKYPFICEMNAASMKLANSINYGTDNEDINFEEPPPPRPSPSESEIDTGNSGSQSGINTENGDSQSGINTGNTKLPLALSGKTNSLSMSTIVIFLGVGIILIVGAIVGYKTIQKKKQVADDNDNTGKEGDVSHGRPSFTSSVGSMMDE